MGFEWPGVVDGEVTCVIVNVAEALPVALDRLTAPLPRHAGRDEYLHQGQPHAHHDLVGRQRRETQIGQGLLRGGHDRIPGVGQRAVEVEGHADRDGDRRRIPTG